MPFANVRGVVAGRLQVSRQHRRARIEPIGLLAFLILDGVRVQRSVNAVSRRITSRHRRRAAGGTHRAEHIELLEVRSLAREAVHVRGLQPILRAMTSDVTPPEVIGEDEDDVWL